MYKSVCKEDGVGEDKEDAQGKIARRLAFARLNAVRCGGGMTPFSHHSGTRVGHSQINRGVQGEAGGTDRWVHAADAGRYGCACVGRAWRG